MVLDIAQLTVLLLSAAVCLSQTKLIPFEENGRWGYRDVTGKVTISPRFKLAQDFGRGGIASVIDAEGWAYIDGMGKVVIRPLVLDNGPDYFSEGVARFRRDGKFGFFDNSGKVVIQARFDFVRPFHEGRAAFCTGCAQQVEDEHSTIRGGAWGYIDRKGHILISPRFEAAEDFSKGRARVRSKGKWTTVNRQ